jgi:hypothetical protein
MADDPRTQPDIDTATSNGRRSHFDGDSDGIQHLGHREPVMYQDVLIDAVNSASDFGRQRWEKFDSG